MSVSQAWLNSALASSVEGPQRTERVAMWVAAHYPAGADSVRFDLAQVRDAIRCRSYAVVIKALRHLENDGLLKVSVSPDGLHYCVTSSHLIDRIPDTCAPSCRCDTKCDINPADGTTPYTVSDTPLKGSMILVASQGSATQPPTKQTFENHKRAWTLWRECKLGSGKAGHIAKNQGQSDENVKKRIEAIVAKHGWPIVERIIRVEADDAKRRGWSYNFATFVRSHLTGLIEDALKEPETALGSTIDGQPVSGVVDEVDRLVVSHEMLSSLKASYHVRYEQRVDGVDWVWTPYAPQEVIDRLQSDIARAPKMGKMGIRIVREEV